MIAPLSAGPLLDAAKANDKAQVDQFLKSGADVCALGPQGDTALHWAAFHGNETMARRLIGAGAGIDVRVNNGSTPLHLAAYNGHTGVVKILIAHGAKVNARTLAGVTPLDWAERNGHPAVAQLLRANGGESGTKPPTEDTLADHQEIRSDKTGDLPQLNQILTRYGLSKTPDGASAAGNEDSRKEKTARPDSPVPGDAFRIQLAAFGSEQRAAETWERYQKQHPEILGHRKLILDRISANGKKYYRVQTGNLTRINARSLCARLKRRSQPCIVIKPQQPHSAADL